jgi:O-antigen/teichoic acid export membrane protein
MWEQLKQLGRHSVIYGIGVMATQAVGFILIPIYTRVLTPADYGVYEVINRSLDVLIIFLGVGLRVTAIRFYQDGDDLRVKNRIISTAVLFMVPLGLAIILGMLAFAPSWSRLLFGGIEHTRLVRLALGLAFAELCFIIPAAYIIARLRSVLFITVSVGKFVVGILLNIYFVYYLRRGVEGILLANLLNSAVFSVILLYVTLREVGLGFDRSRLSGMLRFGLPFVPGGIFSFILNSGDRFFLLHYGGETAVGLYALGYKFATLISMFVMGPFVQVWGALMVPISRRADGPEMLARVFIYMMFLYTWIGLGLSVLSVEVVELVADPKFHSAHQIIPLVVLAYLFWSTINIGDTPFFITKRTAIKPFIFGAAAIVNLTLYRLLIPTYGGWGAAWATLISFVFFAVLTRIVAQKVMFIPYHNFRFLGLLLTAGVFYGLARIIPWPYPTPVWKAVFCLLFPLGLFVIGFFDRTEKDKIRELWQTYLQRGKTGDNAEHETRTKISS